jgi:hypothetical protein
MKPSSKNFDHSFDVKMPENLFSGENYVVEGRG